MAINFNGVPGPYFKSSHGVRQGDPLSSLLFNLIVGVVEDILDKARAAGHIHAVVFHLIAGGGLTHL